MKNLVSIITPCYNGELYISRFFDSILNQTYKDIELIFINDGSNDKTESIALGYAKKFQEAGIYFKYIYQENQGQAAAVNRGLKLFSGKYLTWPDSDDFLMSESIQRRVEFLEHNSEYGFVRSDAYIYIESHLKKPIKKLSRNSLTRFGEHIFERLLFEQNMYCMPGIYLVRAKAFFDVIPNRDIFCSRGGQNWQIQLPIAYKYKCGFIDEPLFGYVVRENSHSHSLEGNDLIKVFDRYDTLKEIMEKTIDRMSINKEKYQCLINQKYERLKFISAINQKKYDICKIYYDSLKKKKCLHPSDRIRYIFRKILIAQRMVTDLNKLLFYFGIYNF